MRDMAPSFFLCMCPGCLFYPCLFGRGGGERRQASSSTNFRCRSSPQQQIKSKVIMMEVGNRCHHYHPVALLQSRQPTVSHPAAVDKRWCSVLEITGLIKCPDVMKTARQSAPCQQTDTNFSCIIWFGDFASHPTVVV